MSEWTTCHHLNKTCPVPKASGSVYCSYHCCPVCKGDKSSSSQACTSCTGKNGTASNGNGRNGNVVNNNNNNNNNKQKKGRKLVLNNNEEDNLKALLHCGALSADEYENRMQNLKEKAKRIHARHRTPRSPDEIKAGYVTPIVDCNEHELVYKFSFDYTTKEWAKTLMVVRIDKDAFQEGAMRAAYKMLDLSKPESQAKFVAKSSKTKNESMLTYFTDVEMQGMCQYFAEEYNKRSPPKKVEFIECFLIERFNQPGRPLMACEPFLEGEYVKYSNNFGYVSSDERNTPQSFSHFSHWSSGQKYIVVDVQGVGDKYTDPQVHSWDAKGFGKGNVGQEGIDKFFSSHKCNAICKHLGLTDKVVDTQGTVMRSDEFDLDSFTCDGTPEKRELEYLGLTADQYRAIGNAFKKSDTDGSGEISLPELPKLCRMLNVDIPTDRLVEVMRDVDVDGSGEISFGEFIMWWTGHEIKRRR